VKFVVVLALFLAFALLLYVHNKNVVKSDPPPVGAAIQPAPPIKVECTSPQTAEIPEY